MGSDHVLDLFSPGSDSAQGSDVSLRHPKGEALEGLDWEEGWGRGDALGDGDSLSGTFEHVGRSALM